MKLELKDKFEKICYSKYKKTFNKHELDIKTTKDCVLDLADNISERELKVLNLGPKFAVTPKTIPYMDIITTTEVEALNLERKGQHSKAELLRRQVKKILIEQNRPRSNLTKQRETIKEMRNNKEIDIYPYDKGNGFVRLTKEMSTIRMIEGIGKTKILNKDPTKTFLTKIQRILCNIKKESNMPKGLYKQLYPSDAIIPRAYGQCKAHKPAKEYPFRILVSTIGTAQYQISKYLVKIIQPTLSKSKTTVTNSKEFVEKAKTWIIERNEIQVSYDVVALYPSVPIKKAIDNLMKMLKDDFEDFKTRTLLKLKHVRQLLEVSLEKSYFLYNNEIHHLEDSGPIGLSLMVVLAESYLQMIEKKAIIEATKRKPPVNPISHFRYVDDTHDRFMNKKNSEEFLKILNRQDPQIQFTAEYESSNKVLNYLDVSIHNNGNGSYDFKVFRKDAITNIQIKPESCHDDKIKNGVFKGFILRAKAICSDKYLQDEINFIKQIFIENGYDRNHLEKIIANIELTPAKIRNDDQRYASLPWIPGLSQKLKKAFKKADCAVSFKSPRNLESLLTSRNKPKLPDNSQPGVYFFPTSCGSGYTGETKKQIRTRNQEHKEAVFKGNKSDDAIAEHANTCNCELDWDRIKTIAVEPFWFRRKVREALEIRRLKTGPDQERGLNRDLGDYVETHMWSPLYDKINKIQGVPTFESMSSTNDVNTRH